MENKEDLPRDKDLQGKEWSDKPEESLPRVASMSDIETKKRDYTAICVFCAVLAILIACLFFLWRDLHTQGPGWLHGIKGKVKSSLDLFQDGSGMESGGSGEKSVHIQKGYRLYKADRFEAALEELEKALKEDPGNSAGYFWRGRAFLKMEEYDRALEEFQRSVEFGPQNAEAHANLGWLYGRRNEYQEGIRHLSKTVELDPDNGWAYYNRGRMYQKIGEREKAILDAKKACDLGFRLGCKVYRSYKDN